MQKILIVDDVPTNVKILGELLKGSYDILVANNGNKAVQVAKMKLPDLILMDVIMPEMDGFAACKALKEYSETAEIPVIFITAKNETDDIVKGFDAGGVDYLTKPFNPSELYARVKTHLELKRSREELEAANSELRQAKNHLVKISGDLKWLLNNTGQGFLYFTGDLRCGSVYSAECLRLFGCGDITGISIVDLLFPAIPPSQPPERSTVARILSNIFSKGPEMREVYLSLLPAEIILNDRVIQLVFKPISDNTDGSPLTMMLILTDITEKRALEKRMEDERHFLRMVVTVVTNLRDFKDIIRDYTDFCSSIEGLTGRRRSTRELLDDLYLPIHTFKGNFSQLEMPHITGKLHDLESEIAKMKRLPELTGQEVREFLLGRDIKAWLQEDLAVLTEALGPAFLDKGNTVEIEVEKLCEIERQIETVFGEAESRPLLLKIRKLRYQPFQSLLRMYPDYARKLSERLEKSVNPVVIENGEFAVDPGRYHSFAKSLVHIFRNALDHGVESPEERLHNGKEEYGTILCRAELADGCLVLTIADDGRGLDLEKIKERAVAAGLSTPESLELMEPEEVSRLIFSGELSTKERVSSLSGRGVGLKAVLNEVEALQGQVKIESRQNEGTSFRFILPCPEAWERE